MKLKKQHILIFINNRAHYPNGHRLVMDNDPKHTSMETKAWMSENGIVHWKTPAQSPVDIFESF
jgi:hypothetical protein